MREATVTKRGDSGHWFMIGEVITQLSDIDEDGSYEFINEDGKRQWLYPEEFEYTGKVAPTNDKFEKGDLVVINDIRKIMFGDEFFTEGKPLRVMEIDRDGDVRLEADAYDGMGNPIVVDGVPTFLVTEDEFHALTHVEEEL